MKAKVVPIGNSRGVRIPKPVLEQCGINTDVELTVKDGAIVIEAIDDESSPRRDWACAFAGMHEASDDRLLIDDSLDLEDGDWIW